MQEHGDTPPTLAVADTAPPSPPSLPPSLPPADIPTLAALLARWLRAGVRSVTLRQPRWAALPAPPAAILGLCAIGLLASLLLQRLWIVGPAIFYWQALLAGWLAPAAAAWGCYALLHRSTDAATEDGPNASQLFCLLLAQGTILSTAYGALWAALIHSGRSAETLSSTVLWALWISLWAWLGLAQTLTLLHSTPRKAWALATTVLLLTIGAVENANERQPVWVADAQAAGNDKAPAPLRLTQEVMETQPQLLAGRLQDLQAQRPGVVDLYALTFAPYAHEDVFRRESQMVADVLATRFDTGGRSLQLVNHAETVAEWPWATPLNLKRAIFRVAELMDRDEDILFIHLTSHGAHNGELAAQFWPLSVDAVTPQRLKEWLDEAGIRHRVVSVSACYSGSWIAPLKDERTLVMTAADSTHTSFGCGRQSELTYFGRAVYDEQLRLHTRSFEQAHAAARPLIEQREQAAGKTDGYSNPQLESGGSIRAQLELLRRRLENG